MYFSFNKLKTLSFPKKIYNNTHNNEITITSGWVGKIDMIDKSPQGLAIMAQQDDFNQIVGLIYDDQDIGKSYKYNELVQQLKERNLEGFSRNMVIKHKDIVIAHACTNAEIKNIAVVGELIVRKEYRNRGFASEIWRDICVIA